MFIYCFIFLLLAVFAAEHDAAPLKKVDFLLIITGVLLIVFTGLRDVSVSRDYDTYLLAFKTIRNGIADEGSGILPALEPAFVWIVSASYDLFEKNGHIAVMMVFATLSLVLKVFSIKKLSVNPFLVLLLYYSQYFFLQEMTQIRNAMACSLFLVAIYFYLKEQYTVVVMLILVAFLFHNSAIFYFIIFLFKKEKRNTWFFGALLIIAAVLGLIKIPFLSMLTGVDLNQVSNKLTTYADIAGKWDYRNVRFFNVLNIFNYFITAYVLIYAAWKKINDPRLTLFLKCSIVSLFMYGLLLDIPSVAARFSELLGVLFPFMFAYAIRLFPFNKFNILFAIVVAGVYLYVNLFYGQLVQPYKVIGFR